MTPIPAFLGLFALAAFSLWALFFPTVLVSAGRHLRHLAFSEAGWLVQRVNRGDPEKVFIAVYNTYATAAMANGQAVMWDYPTDADGLGVTRSTARATSGGFAGAGIIAEPIPAGSYGLMQVYGYHAAVRMRTVTGGTPAIVAGRPLVMPIAGALFCMESISTASKTIVSWPLAFALGATSGFTTATKAAFLKFL